MQQSFLCSSCGSYCTLGQRFCTVCGWGLHYKCRRCSAVVDPKFRFCTNCGVELAWGSRAQVEKAGKDEDTCPAPSSIENVISYIADREIRGLAEAFLRWVESWRDERVQFEPVEKCINLKVMGTVFSQLQPRRKSFSVSYFSTYGKLKNYKVVNRDSLAAARRLVKKSFQLRSNVNVEG